MFSLSRFIVARNYVVEDAFKQLATAVEWRREFKPLTVQCKWCHETPGFHSIVSSEYFFVLKLTLPLLSLL
ncbi:unnamed protein product [Trichobilharzia regenti]|nr:unnamed protein product [Trichobilharzia regenti]